ncbi:type VI secretion system tube protein Hcp [Luteolibacter sp. GHJ8]|uniref:Type VI secretion system tube protein Hcp n=1 Tax=Luteolibacter rhizosphaerae TaxID=2989719 RepID=A0ABT3G4B4_9BACT|nr:type VI secretion system tube protein Hcp [Luteolibacter rhizosphaerae]MCW1914683.1 type VI secretion system tube protein Hcp [Luteolibacter rhizosphaerae]
MRTLRPSSLSRTLALAAPAVSLVVTRADAAFDTFIKFSDIKGESVDKVHREWCNALSFSFGTETPVLIGGSGSGAGKATAKPFIITKRVDKASPQLFLQSVQGQPLPTVTMELATTASATAPVVFYKIVLTNAFVTKIDSSGAAGDDGVSETIELSYEKISIIYSALDAKGVPIPQPEVTWNFAENTK